jgi:succinyl-CoA synthetase alpha subunit
MAESFVNALVKRNAYVDSITLLQVTSEVMALAGVLDAALVMASELNREILRDTGLLVDEAQAAGSNDLVIAVRAGDQAAMDTALAQAESLLAGRRVAPESASRTVPRSVRSAHRADPEARLAVISVPGQYAASEARQALVEGLHVFLFSANVSIEDEVDLKQRARDRGLVVMGPDCGTAILNGIGFGFANLTRRGRIGVVGASGTGIQEVVSLVHRAGGGISHAIGTGSRDLHAEVGGIVTRQALELLRQDPQTETIVLISKPSDGAVASAVLHALAATGKRAIAYLQGQRVAAPKGVEVADSLEDAARLTAALIEPDGVSERLPTLRLNEGQRQIRGLFCGGTLCQEAAAAIGGNDGEHQFTDFGDDEYTRGRAHPMIDPTLRNQAIVQAGADPRVAVILLDVILGLASHPDPSGAAAPAIREAVAAAAAARRELGIVAHVVGTDLDPQDLAKQEATLRSCGVHISRSNIQAANAASRLLHGVTV